MTVNKLQGHTFIHAGLDLYVECFWHVALSRVTSKENMFTLSHEETALYIVYKGILSS